MTISSLCEPVWEELSSLAIYSSFAGLIPSLMHSLQNRGTMSLLRLAKEIFSALAIRSFNLFDHVRCTRFNSYYCEMVSPIEMKRAARVAASAVRSKAFLTAFSNGMGVGTISIMASIPAL